MYNAIEEYKDSITSKITSYLSMPNGIKKVKEFFKSYEGDFTFILIFCIENKYFNVIDLLISKKYITVGHQWDELLNAFHKASMSGDNTMVTYFTKIHRLYPGTDNYVPRYTISDALHSAIVEGHSDVIKIIATYQPSSLNHHNRSYDGSRYMTSLRVACEVGDISIIRLLISLGATDSSILYVSDYCLEYAIAANRIDIIIEILSGGLFVIKDRSLSWFKYARLNRVVNKLKGYPEYDELSKILIPYYLIRSDAFTGRHLKKLTIELCDYFKNN